MDINALKSRGKVDLNKLIDAAKEDNNTGGYNKELIWKPKLGDDGNGYAILRFLPAPENSPLPWAKWWDHGFKGPTGKWFIEKSLTTFGEDCPVSEFNTKLWNSVDSDNTPERKQARDQKRQLHYITNVLVVDDPVNPANNGRVMLYKFGKKVFDILSESMQPTVPTDDPVNPFDIFEGCDFVLKINTVKGQSGGRTVTYWNYDRSTFKAPSVLFDGDEDKINGVLGQLNSFEEWTERSNYKTYAEMKSKLYSVLGIREDAVVSEPTPEPTYKSAPEPELKSAPVEEVPQSASDVDDDDDDLAYFKRLAAED